MSEPTKRCARCGEVKPRSAFYTRRRNGKESVRGACRACENARRYSALHDANDIRLPVGPWRTWLVRRANHYQTLDDFGIACGFEDSRQIRRWLREYTSVWLSSVDEILCIFDEPAVLNELYPLSDDELARVA